MPPTRKKTVKKRFLNDAVHDKEARSSEKTRPSFNGKKKLSDMLGPEWTKEELRRFYRAYMAHGKHWKRVATEFQNRSVEMVETLYKINKAYLSLPKGMASEIGFVAMMSDHYAVLEADDSERESNDTPVTSKKFPKRKRQNFHRSAPKENSRSVSLDDGCLSFLKRRLFDGQPRVVGKRTPRVPVAYPSNDDDEVAHAAALTLTKASNTIGGSGSPQISLTPSRRAEHAKASSSIRSWDRMFPDSQSPSSRGGCSLRGCSEGGMKRRDACAVDPTCLEVAGGEGVGTVEIDRKGKKFYGKRAEEVENCHSDDGAEACSATNEGKTAEVPSPMADVTPPPPPRGRWRQNKKLFSGDEFSALDALQTLAHLSVLESDEKSATRLNEERSTHDIDDRVPEAASACHQKEKARLSGKKENADLVITPRASGLGKQSVTSDKSISEKKQLPFSVNSNVSKRKRQPSESKVSKIDGPADQHLSKPPDTKALEEVDNIMVLKDGGHISALSTQLKSIELSEESSFSCDHKSASNDPPASTAPAARIPSNEKLPASKRCKLKMDLKQVFNVVGEGRSPHGSGNAANKNSGLIENGVLDLKEKLSSCLSSRLVRRWCSFEWFYSAIDYPWFAKREFLEYLNHVGLGHIPRLTRIEWGVIRNSLGKPRRFSEYFLSEEREKLRQYRESVREHYSSIHSGAEDGAPSDVGNPLSVGQRVIAVHPKTREVYDGSVLTVDHDRCRIQFDRHEMGVELVKDVDCMPLNLLDNMRESLCKQRFLVFSKELQAGEHPNVEAFLSCAPSDRPLNHGNTSPMRMQVDMNHTIPDIADTQAASAQPCVAELNQAKEADIQALSNLTRALDIKEAWLMELKNINNDILDSQNDGDSSLKDSEHLKQHLATVLVELKEASGQASSALLDLRQRNTYPASTLPPWMKTPIHSSFPGATPPCSHDISDASEEYASSVIELVRGSRLEAHSMVDAAIQAISSVKEGENAYAKIEDALRLRSINTRQSHSESTTHTNKVELANGSLPRGIQFSPEQDDVGDELEEAIHSDLITSCVATLILIQTCTERHHPPAEVVQIIDCVITSLRPACPQNLSLYREIQLCMGVIKTQILSLIPMEIGS